MNIVKRLLFEFVPKRWSDTPRQSIFRSCTPELAKGRVSDRNYRCLHGLPTDYKSTYYGAHMYGEAVFVAASGTTGHYRHVSRGVYQFW